MPGFLGGSTGSSGAGGEITFPKEFIDPVTKLRVSQPETMIDTDFEYGLQPTKWETVELINNTPSFFSKSGDTTIPNITSMVTNAGTREITVNTLLEHGLSVGIPINVTGTKSVTADGAYIIASIPTATSFTYLCRDNQPNTVSIDDLYTSIISGEFFQGSQIRVSDAAGITTDGLSPSTLTVTTDSAHGFKVDTPFYFLNLNSTISQEFQAANTATRSFDSSNSATAQTFDGSNTLSSINIDWSNAANVGGVTSSIASVSTAADTITVNHGTENFVGRAVGTPLYYNVTAATGYFNTNPRGVVFLKALTSSTTSASTFTVSDLPDGNVIDLTSSMTGTFQLANQARTFAGNNVNAATQTTLTIVKDTPQTFDATNASGATLSVASYSAGNVTLTSLTDPLWYQGTMVFYSTTGSAATGLTNNTTYFVDTFFRQGTSNNYTMTLKPLPTGSVITSISGGTGTQTFQQIYMSIDKDVFHLKDNGWAVGDMLEYAYPAGGRFSVATSAEIVNYYFVEAKYDAHNIVLNQTTGDITPRTVATTVDRGTTITPTTATTVGLTAPITFSVLSGVLPSGLSLNTSTGSISGTPVEAIASPGREVVIRATDSFNNTAFQTHTFIINATVGSVNPSTVSRENISSGVAMTAITFTTTNLVAPLTWAISSGTLPTGLSFNSSNGSITGTPTEQIAAPGRQVIVRATDVGGLQGFSTITFQINPPPNLYSFTSATFTTGGASGRFGPDINQARSGVGNPSWAAAYVNMSTAGIIDWTVPQTANYQITMASGGGGDGNGGNFGRSFGAVVRGNSVPLTQGQVVRLVVGQAGADGTGSYAGGGGGGSFMFIGAPRSGTIIMAAGGAGGASEEDSGNGQHGQGFSSRSDFNATNYFNQPKTNNGSGGTCPGAGANGGGGVGWLGDGQDSATGASGQVSGGRLFTGGDANGGGTGGWGGGAGDGGSGSGGGGGGYTGGDAGPDNTHRGGCGSSYINPAYGSMSWVSNNGQGASGYITIVRL